MVCSLRFEDGSVHFTNRFVRSEKFVAEEQAGSPVFRAFGTAFEHDRLKRGIMLESPVNVSVYPYRGTLLAFGEQGLPYELDPETLETRGEFKFGGSLNDISPFAAHPKFDRWTGEMFNFGIAFSVASPCLNVYLFDQTSRLVYRKRLRLDFPCSLHDFVLSPSYAVFYLSPYILDMRSLAGDGRTLMQSLSWEPERRSRLLVVARATGEPVASIAIGHGYCLHTINCFEASSQLVVDVLELDRPIYDQYQEVPALFTSVGEGQPVRYVVDMNTFEVLGRHECDYKLAPDFPSIDPRNLTLPYNDFWMLGISATGRSGRKFFDQLVHARWTDRKHYDIYEAPPMRYLAGEPIFIGDPRDETTGAVICQEFDARQMTSSFVIFDARNIARGPVAALRLREPIHLGFHASFDNRFVS